MKVKDLIQHLEKFDPELEAILINLNNDGDEGEGSYEINQRNIGIVPATTIHGEAVKVLGITFDGEEPIPHYDGVVCCMLKE